MKDIRKDSLFYFHSGGGVTLSGGDVLMQADFAKELLKACREECINTAAELDMFGLYDNIQKLMPYLDSYFVDLKHMDKRLHQKWTGVENTTILTNVRRVSQEFPHIPLYARVPLIPNVNDSKENILQTAEFCTQLPSCVSLEFLPFHRLGASAYEYLGREYVFEEVSALSREEALERISVLPIGDLPFEVKISGIAVKPQ